MMECEVTVEDSAWIDAVESRVGRAGGRGVKVCPNATNCCRKKTMLRLHIIAGVLVLNGSRSETAE
jgi:hypothetical protein